MDTQDVQHNSHGFSGVTHDSFQSQLENWAHWDWDCHGRRRGIPGVRRVGEHEVGTVVTVETVPHPHRHPAAAPSAPAPAAQGHRARPHARCGAVPRFWTGPHLPGTQNNVTPCLSPLPVTQALGDTLGTHQAARTWCPSWQRMHLNPTVSPCADTQILGSGGQGPSPAP